MKILLTLLCILQLTISTAQNIERDLISNSGGHIQGDNINIHWSTGEIAVTTNLNGIKISEGFHQGTSITTSVIDTESKINISVYPNPTSDIINIQNKSGAPITAFITKSNGALVQQIKISDKHQQIDCSSLLAGTYIITFKNLENLTKSFKLIKT